MIETQPELVAHHYTEADLPEQAIAYWHSAGHRASERSAYQEAMSHLTTGLTLLQIMPETQARHQQELALATELAHPFSHAFALNIASMELQFRREGQGVYEHADASVILSTEQGFPHWLAFSTILRGWAVADLGQQEEGLVQMRQGLSDWCDLGAELFVPYYLSLMAEAYSGLEQVEAGLGALKEGLEVMGRTGEDWWKAEMYRRTGVLLLQQTTPDVTQAETHFHQALVIAHQQQAKSFELRAAMNLAQLWRQQDKDDQARKLLGPVYTWFTEGLETADLMEAQSILSGLEAPDSDAAAS